MREKFTHLAKAMVLAACMFAAFGEVSASHIMGSDISFTCNPNNPNQYDVVVTLYRDCDGISAPTSISVSVSSSCGTQSVTAAQDPLNSGIEVSQLCNTAQSTCGTGSLPGVQVYTYRATVTVQPNCGVYTFSYDECCRNTSNNIVSPTSQGFMVRATLNSNLVNCNTAPSFTSLPVPYFCVNQPVNYSHGALDVEGDSLVYSLIPPLDDLGTNIAYTGGYSATNPLPTASGFNFDPQTGQMTFTPTQQGVYVVDVLVSEYRNGQLIGTTMRDIQIVVINCTNNAPSVISCLTPNAVTGATLIDCNSLGVCPGQTVTFNLVAGDLDNQPITVTSNIASSIPGATLTTTQIGGPDSVLVTFNWTPLGTDTGFRYFTVQFEDDACPIPGLQLFTYDITVLPGTTVGPDRAYCTGGGPVQVTATGGTHFSWTPTTGMVSANADSSVVFFAPSTTTTYYVQSDLQAGCKTRDTITISNVNTFSTATSSPDDTICLNASTTVSVTGTPATEGPFTYTWGPSNSGVANPGNQSTTVRPSTTTMYQVTVVSSTGCTVRDSIQVVIQGIAPKIIVTPSDNYVCPGSPVTLNSLVKAVECGPNADPQNPCLPGGQFLLRDMGTGTTNAAANTTPYIGFWEDGRVQYLYRASELQALGLTAGTITDIAFDIVTKNSTDPYNDFTVKMGCTSLNQLPNTFVQGLQQVGNPVAYTTAVGWNTHTLDVPFNWDGFSNLIIEICFNNLDYTQYDNVRYTPTSYTNSVLWDNGDLGAQSGCTALTSPVTGQNRPNTRFIMCTAPLSNYTFTWTGSDGSTLPNTPNPTATVNNNVTYSVIIDDGTCQGDTVVNLFVDSGVLVSAGNDTAICNTATVELQGEWLNPTTPVCSSSYAVTSIPYSLITPTGTVTNVTAFSPSTDDGISAAIPIPFPFRFYCQSVTNLYICTNGFVAFNNSSTAFTPAVIPTAAVPNNYIALFWRDLNFTSGTISRFVNGTAPNRVMVIRYVNVPVFTGGGTVSGEIQLYENGNIELHQTNFPSGTYTMGIENASGTFGNPVPGANAQNVNFTTPRAYRFRPLTVGTVLQSVLWTPGATLSSDTTLKPIATPTANTQYVLEATFNNGCVTRDTVNVAIGDFPYSVSAAADTICPGDSVQLFFNGLGVSYSWTPANSVSPATAQNPFATPSVTTEYFVTAFDSIGCRADDSVTINVHFQTPATLGPDTLICPSSSVTLSPSGGPYVSYQWSTSATTPTITTAAQTASMQDYWVTLYDGICYFNSDTVTVSEYILTPIVVQPSGDTAVCLGDSITLVADPGYVSYQWSNGATSPVLVTSTPGLYSYIATDQNGCTINSQDTANVIGAQHPTADILTDDDNICAGQTSTVLYVNPANGIVYIWNPGNVVSDSLTVSTAGQYTLIASDNGCNSFDTIDIASTQPQVVDLGPARNSCSCDTGVVLTSNITGSYVWSTGDSTQSISVTTSGLYTVTVTDNNECTAVDDVLVDAHCLTADAVVADPPEGTVFVGRNAGLNTTTSYTGQFEYLWTPPTFLDDSTKKDPTVQNPDITTTYVVMVTDLDYGCVAYDSVTLAVLPPAIPPMPNAFTPNGDGHNDTYGPVIPANFQQFWSIADFKIYNRWGQLVYSGTGNWDGNVNGTLQPMETYVYYITLTGPDQNDPNVYINYNLTGSFTLLH